MANRYYGWGRIWTFHQGILISQYHRPLTSTIGWALTKYDPWKWANGLITALMVLAAVTAFTFTIEHKGVLGWTTKIGRFVIMFALGMNAAGLENWYLQYAVTKIEQLLATFGIIPWV